MKLFKQIIKILPTVLTALILAVVVWVAAVSASDPNEEVSYDTPVTVEILGQNPDLTITQQSAQTIQLTIKAPRSIHNQLNGNFHLVRATLNLAELGQGEHTLKPQVRVDIGPIQIMQVLPQEINLTLEEIISTNMEITPIYTGDLPIGYEAGEAELSAESVQIVGAATKVNQVTQVVAPIDLTNVITNVSRNIELKALDRRGNEVTGLNLSPSRISMDLPIKQLAGYRNVFVKIVTYGTIAQGYHLTSLVVNPPNLTIYAADPSLVTNMPAYVETTPINLNGAQESFSVQANLQLQDGVRVVGDTIVTVDVGIDAIESSDQLTEIPVEIINLEVGSRATISPTAVDIYISGPMNILELVSTESIRIILDLAGKGPGTYQLSPSVEMDYPELWLDSILPGTIEVVITR